MVESIYREAARPHNPDRCPTLVADRTRRCSGEPLRFSHPDIVNHPLVTPDDQLRLVGSVEADGQIAIGDLVACIPDHPAPVAAIMVLVDIGLLVIDRNAPFDTAVQLWRPAPPPR